MEKYFSFEIGKVLTLPSAFNGIEPNEDGIYTIDDMRLGPDQMQKHFGIGSNTLSSGVRPEKTWPGGGNQKLLLSKSLFQSSHQSILHLYVTLQRYITLIALDHKISVIKVV